MPTRYVPLIAYLLFLFIGHPLAFLPEPAGTVALTGFAVLVPAAVLLQRYRRPTFRWRMPFVLAGFGAVSFIGGLLWLWSMEPNNDMLPMFTIFGAHAAMILCAIIAASQEPPSPVGPTKNAPVK